jgi:pimeloyl-ACP methyl ester carboxylesterase
MRLALNGVGNFVPGCGAQVGDIVDTAIVPIYKPALDFLNQIAPKTNYSFPWDWRTSPANTLAALDTFIDNVRNNNSGSKVVLMAHSMGGLLARWYIDDPARAAKVDRLLTLGTPYWGSPKALFPLAAGIETPGFSPLDLFVNNSDLKAFAINALGLYTLYPSANYGPWLTVTDKSPSPLDRAGVLDYVGNTLGGNMDLLGEALDSHANILDGFKTNGVKYRVVAGTGLNTVGAINIHPLDSTGKNIELALISGDQTVPGISANQGPLGSQAPLGEAVPSPMPATSHTSTSPEILPSPRPSRVSCSPAETSTGSPAPARPAVSKSTRSKS